MQVEQVGQLLLLRFDQEIPRRFYVDLINRLMYDYVEYDSFSGKYTSSRRYFCKHIADNVLCVPRGFLLKILELVDKHKIPVSKLDLTSPKLTPNWKKLEGHINLRPLQRSCLTVLAESLNEGVGGVVIAPPAYGKSFLISALALLYNDYKIDVISKRRDVILGNHTNLTKYLGNVGLVTSGVRKKERVTVYTADSLHHCDFTADLVIADEVHELVTDKYYSALNRYTKANFLGLTATYDTRFDNLYKRIEAICGPILYKVEYDTIQQAGLVVPIMVYWYDSHDGKNPISGYKNPVLRKKYGIWRNRYRNTCVANAAREVFRSGRQTLVLTETIEHALILQKLLPEFEVCYSGNSKAEGDFPKDLEYQTISNALRDELKKKFVNREIMGMIATGIWSVGVSFDSLECLVRAEGSGSKTSATQAPGRVCRISPDIEKQYGLVIDFTDKFDSGFRHKALQRQRIYANNFWVQRLPNGTFLEPKRRSR